LKHVVIDPEDPSQYPDPHYHTMYSASSLVVGDISPDHPPELHVFVDDDKCPREITDGRLIFMLCNKGDDLDKTVLKSEWFVGFHIVNLHRFSQIKTLMHNAEPVLQKCSKDLRPVGRSTQRHDPSFASDRGLHEVGNPRPDQTGHMQAPHNFKRPTDEVTKFYLMSDAHYLVDFVMAVYMFSFSHTDIRSPRRYSRSSFICGGERQLHMTGLLLVLFHSPSELMQACTNSF
jgi:hypothetical protein